MLLLFEYFNYFTDPIIKTNYKSNILTNLSISETLQFMLLKIWLIMSVYLKCLFRLMSNNILSLSVEQKISFTSFFKKNIFF